MMNRRRFLGVSALALAATSLPALAQSLPVGNIFTKRGVAIRGADPVAYFTQGEPVYGDAAYAYEWAGATWHFASAESRDAFAADPEAYAPQYGGNCAWAVSQGYTASTVPEAWKIVDGKLYLNYSRRVQRNWERDIPGNIASGNANWPALAAG